jgi:hypothetical protein
LFIATSRLFIGFRSRAGIGFGSRIFQLTDAEHHAGFPPETPGNVTDADWLKFR